jgi:hypothetical protein
VLGALEKICVSASFICGKATVAKMRPIVQLVFKVNNKIHTSRTPISEDVAEEIKKDWEQGVLASFNEDRYHV